MRALKRLVMDLDDTISFTTKGDYANAEPDLEVIKKLRSYKEQGFDIVIYTARNMRTYEGNVGRINANTLPIIVEWLNQHEVPYDEIITGKPWCGFDGFYVDDKAIRPSEFKNLDYAQVLDLLGGTE